MKDKQKNYNPAKKVTNLYRVNCQTLKSNRRAIRK